MTWLPMGDRILVQRDKPPEHVAEGGLVAPDVAVEAPTVGTVVAVGPDVKRLKARDHVQFPATSGYGNLAGGLPPDWLIMREDEVMAVEVRDNA